MSSPASTPPVVQPFGSCVAAGVLVELGERCRDLPVGLVQIGQPRQRRLAQVRQHRVGAGQRVALGFSHAQLRFGAPPAVGRQRLALRRHRESLADQHPRQAQAARGQQRGGREVEQDEVRLHLGQERAPGTHDAAERLRVQEADAQQCLCRAQRRRQAADIAKEHGRLQHREGRVAEQRLHMRQVAQHEHRRVPAPSQLTAERGQPHHMAVIGTNFPGEQHA